VFHFTSNSEKVRCDYTPASCILCVSPHTRTRPHPHACLRARKCMEPIDLCYVEGARSARIDFVLGVTLTSDKHTPVHIQLGILQQVYIWFSIFCHCPIQSTFLAVQLSLVSIKACCLSCATCTCTHLAPKQGNQFFAPQ
jgi:hypothetical protein